MINGQSSSRELPPELATLLPSNIGVAPDPFLEEWLPNEAAADELRMFVYKQPVPGVLQTPTYMAMCLMEFGSHLTRRQLNDAIDLRLARQKFLVERGVNLRVFLGQGVFEELWKDEPRQAKTLARIMTASADIPPEERKISIQLLPGGVAQYFGQVAGCNVIQAVGVDGQPLATHAETSRRPYVPTVVGPEHRVSIQAQQTFGYFTTPDLVPVCNSNHLEQGTLFFRKPAMRELRLGVQAGEFDDLARGCSEDSPADAASG